MSEARRDPPAVDPAVAVHVLRHLRKKRWFDLLAAVSEALIEAGLGTGPVVCLFAQALVDRGLPSAALAILDWVDAEDARTAAEAAGLRGRAYKQMFVAVGRDSPRAPGLLDQAIAAYLAADPVDPDELQWHRVNAAALIVQKTRLFGPDHDTPDPQQLVCEIRTRVIRSSADPDAVLLPWDAASCMEACLVLGRYDEAITWAERYAADRRADAFELAGTLRQLTEVWRIRPDGPEGPILHSLRSAILEREEGERVELSPDDLRASSSGLEKVLGREGMVTYTWYRTGLDRSRSIGAVSSAMDEPVGTGFLVEGSDLSPSLSAGPVFVTNAHVIGPDAGAVDPADARIRFHVLMEESLPSEFGVGDLIWTSPPHLLDTTVLRLDGPVGGAEPCPLTSAVPRLDGTQRVYVVGHPQGRSLSYAIDDNVLLDGDERVLHYRAPTEPGNSGSPVFNRSWKVIGLHHAGRLDMPHLHGKPGTYAANEGIWIEAVRQGMTTDLGR